MRILSTVTQHYYGQPQALEPMFLEFTEPLWRMGHEVETFDHVKRCAEVGPDECGANFERHVRLGGYDLIFYQTGGRDFMDRNAIANVSKRTPVVAWNSDDDWQWESYSRHIAPCFTRMITTYPHVYEANRLAFPNLMLSQWGCLDTFAQFDRAKDLDFSFVGQVYRSRVSELRHLRRRAGLKVFGLGALRVKYPPFNNKRFRETVARWFPATNRALPFPEVHELWNRSRISYTPLGASTNPSMLQIKGRVFQMGLSGTLMLVQRCADLARYYEPDKEFISYEGPDDCVEKVAFYLKHESLRLRIAQAYADRTRNEHLWDHRFGQIFNDLGLSAPGKPSRGPIEVSFYGHRRPSAGLPSRSR